MRIAVLDDYADAFRGTPGFGRLGGHAVAIFRDAVAGDALAARLDGFDAVVLTQQRTPLPRAVIERLPALRFVNQTGRNAGHVDMDACTERGVVVSAGGAGGPDATAELCWGLILAALRHIPREVENLRRGRWQDTVGTGLDGKVLGILGYGRIGARVARVGAAFGMRVVCWGREGSLERARADGFEAADSREDFFAAADVLSVHLVLNEHTRGSVAAADLARMKATALFVNTSRAPIVAPGALEAALRAGNPGRAAVDVFESEPVLDAAHPLLAMESALCTPHLGYAARHVYDALYGAAIEQILAFDAGAPINVLNPGAIRASGAGEGGAAD